LPSLLQDALFTYDRLVANRDEVTSNNSESMNNATGVTARCEPPRQLVRSLLEQEHDKLFRDKGDIFRQLGMGQVLTSSADAFFAQEAGAASQYYARDR
jgi:hypothetical protein